MNDCEISHSLRIRCANNGGVILAVDSNVRSLVYRFIYSLLSDLHGYHPVAVIQEFNEPTNNGLSFMNVIVDYLRTINCLMGKFTV
jgi:hypothetical protein